MATPKVKTDLTTAWVDVAGAAASVAGMTWQNLGPGDALISFATSSPSASDAYHVLKRGDAYYDKNGSAHVWAKATTTAALAGTAD